MKKRPTRLETQLKRALSAIERGQYERALGKLENLLPQVQDNPLLAEQVYLAMADACLNLRNLPQAVSLATRAVELNSESEQAYYLLGFACSVAADWDQAISALRQAVMLNPDQAEYYRALGWALFNQDQTNQAGLESLEKALNMSPTHISSLTDLAMLHTHQQNFDMALIYAHRAVTLAPSDSLTQDILHNITYFKQEYERLGGQPIVKLPAKPATEVEWREVIALSADYHQVQQLWLDLHPAEDVDELNAGLQEFKYLWNTTPRFELGGRSPEEMLGYTGV